MNQLGYYGKTPHRGDFVRFNLPQSFVSVWDDWLLSILIAGEQRYQNWSDCYATAPQMRFTLSSGIAGNEVWLGVVRPSQDKVGRRFPFCIACSLTETTPAYATSLLRDDFYVAIETLLDQVFETTYEFDQLQTDLSNLVDQHLSEHLESQSISLASNQAAMDGQLHISVNDYQKEHLLSASSTMLDAIMMEAYGEYSLWYYHQQAKDQAKLVNGLPSVDIGLELFSQESIVAQNTQVFPKNLPLNPVPVAVAEVRPAVEEQLSEENHYQEQAAADLNAESDATPENSDAQPSDEDWAALDEFEEPELTTPVITPEVEPLELDDDIQDAPWDR